MCLLFTSKQRKAKADLWRSPPGEGGASCWVVRQVSWSEDRDSSSGFVSDLHMELCRTDESGTTLRPPPPAHCHSAYLWVCQAPPPAGGNRVTSHKWVITCMLPIKSIDQSRVQPDRSVSNCLSSASSSHRSPTSCSSEHAHWPLPASVGGASSSPLWCHSSISAGSVCRSAGDCVLWGHLSLRTGRGGEEEEEVTV